MSKITFDTKTAEKLGLIPTVVYEVIKQDIQANYADGKHIFEGRAWTRATSHYLMEVMPFISRTTIISALERLVYKKYLIVGYPYNEKGKGGHPAKWFALGENHE
jgi:hypothetical protein